MSVFDSIISESGQRFGLGDRAASLLSSVLGLITDRNQGGLNGFLDRFRQAGLGSVADSWVRAGDNLPLSGEQVESALGTDTVNLMAERAGSDAEKTKSALGMIIPGVVDRLTPDGIVPTEDDLLTKTGGYLTGMPSTVQTGAAHDGARVGEVFDRIGTADTNREIAGFDSNAVSRLEDETILDDSSPLKWIAPLILLALLVAGGWAFCGKAPSAHAANDGRQMMTNAADKRMTI